MNEMVKRAGDALFSRYMTALPDDATEIARVAITALLPPTKAMRDAVRPHLADGSGIPVEDYECDWLIEALIGAALGD